VRSHLFTVHGISLPTTRVKKFDRSSLPAALEDPPSPPSVDPDSLVENLLEKNPRSKYRTRVEFEEELKDKNQILAHSKEHVSQVEMLKDSSKDLKQNQLVTNKTIKLSIAPKIFDKPEFKNQDALISYQSSRSGHPESHGNTVLAKRDSIELAENQTQSLQIEQPFPNSVPNNMTEIVVTVDPNGTIMEVDNSSDQQYLTMKDQNGEMVLIPIEANNASEQIQHSHTSFTIQQVANSDIAPAFNSESPVEMELIYSSDLESSVGDLGLMEENSTPGNKMIFSMDDNCTLEDDNIIIENPIYRQLVLDEPNKNDGPMFMIFDGTEETCRETVYYVIDNK